MPSTLETKRVALQTALRAKAWVGDEERWFFGYFAARDEQATHDEAMDIADRYMEKLKQEEK